MKFESAIGLNRASRNLFVLLALGNVILALVLLVTLVNFSKRDTVVRMLPPIPTTEEMEVASAQANAAYGENWGLFVAQLVGNVNPENIQETVTLLSRIMGPDLQDELRESIKASVENMRIQGFRLRFRPQHVTQDPNSNITYVTGEMTEIPVRGDPVMNRFTYEMKFSLRHGIPVMTHFKAYEGQPDRDQRRRS